MYSYEANGRGNTSATDAKLLERKSQFINLPAVTPEDDGTVLGVNEGKWAPIPGGGGSMMVNFTYTYDEETSTESITADKTHDEIIAAMQSGMVVYGFIDFSAIGEGRYPLGHAILDLYNFPDNLYIGFGYRGNNIDTNVYTVQYNNEDGEWWM